MQPRAAELGTAHVVPISIRQWQEGGFRTGSPASQAARPGATLAGAAGGRAAALRKPAGADTVRPGLSLGSKYYLSI